MAAGLTQEELAARSGVSRMTIGLIEEGHPNREFGKVLWISDDLGVFWTLVPAPRSAFSLDSLEAESEPL